MLPGSANPTLRKREKHAPDRGLNCFLNRDFMWEAFTPVCAEAAFPNRMKLDIDDAIGGLVIQGIF